MTKPRSRATEIEALPQEAIALQEKSKVRLGFDETCELVGTGEIDQIENAMNAYRGLGVALLRYYQRKSRRKLKRGE